MEKLNFLLNSEDFSERTLKKVSSKKTEKGIALELSTFHAFREAYPDSESVFRKIFDTMCEKANYQCACGSHVKYYVQIDKYKFRCGSCKNVISPLSVTPLRSTHIPLNQILEIAYLSFISKHSVSAAEIRRLYGWKYKSALRCAHRIKFWCGLTAGLFKFKNGHYEIDETYVRIPSLLSGKIRFSRGPSSERVKPVIVISERDGAVKGYVVDDVDKYTIQPLIHNNINLISSIPTIHTDGSPVYDFLDKEKENYNHYRCNHKHKKWAVKNENGDSVHVNTAESFNRFLKQTMRIHRGCSEEYLQQYVDHACWIFSNRFNDAHTAIAGLFESLPGINSITNENK